MKTFRKALSKKKDYPAEVSQPNPNPTPTPNPSTHPANDGAASPVFEAASDTQPVQGESPEELAARLVKSFCTSASNGTENDVAYLPSIVEAAVSSPAAAAECARFTRKFMYHKNWVHPTYVFNAVMLLGILSRNPGHTFTRNIDKKYVDTVREVLLKNSTPTVLQILIEVLQDLETLTAMDDGLARIVEMWQKEKAKSNSLYSYMPPPMMPMMPAGQIMSPGLQQWPGSPVMAGGLPGNGSGSGSSGSKLPKPKEIRKRLEEARTTASVLADVVNTSSPEALLQHDLVDDLSARCRRATTQVLEYLNASNPAPDNFEMSRLLDVHEALQQSLHHYYRAVLEARKQLGRGEVRRSESGEVPQQPAQAGKGKATAPLSPLTPGPGSGLGSSGNYMTSARPDGPERPAGDGENDKNGYSYGQHANGSNGGNGGNGNGTSFLPMPDFQPSSRGSPDEDLYSDDSGKNKHSDKQKSKAAASYNNRDDSNGDLALAMAASTAPGANVRPSHRYRNEAENPFADEPAESSRSSSQVRAGPSGGGGGGGPSRSGSGSAHDKWTELDPAAGSSSAGAPGAVYRY